MENITPFVNVESEMVILGTLMTDSEKASEFISNHNISESWFSLDTHKEIFRIIFDICLDGSKPDYAIVEDTFVNSNSKHPFAVQDCSDKGNICAAVREHITILKSKASRRKYHERFSAICAKIKSGDCIETVFGEVDGITQEWFDEQDTEQTLSSLKHIILGRSQTNLHGANNNLFVPMRIAKMEERMIGYMKGKHTIIAARPSVGKTTMICNDIPFICSPSQLGKPTALITLEMTTEEIISKIACEQAKIPFFDYLRGRMKDEHRVKFEPRLDEITDQWPLYLDDKTHNEKTLCNWIRKMVYKHQVEMVFVDYIQLISCSDKRVSSRREQISRINEAIVRCAKELNIAICSTCQLRRPPTVFGKENEEYKPKISDLKECGDLEEGAYAIVLLYPDPRGNSQDGRFLGYSADIAKMRGGRLKDMIVPLRFNMEYGQFTEEYR